MVDVVIVGGGHGAAQVVLSLKQLKFTGSITLVSDEDSLPYQRPPLSKAYLKGEMTRERLVIHRQKLYDDMNVDLRLSTRVEAIDSASKTIQLSSGDSLGYGALVLATGGRARQLSVAGADLPAVATLRSVGDVDRLKPAFDAAQSLVIVGGGYVGLEAAAVARSAGKAVTVLEAEDRLLKRVTAPVVSDFYYKTHSDHGATILLNKQVTRFSEAVTGAIDVTTSDGETITADLALVGVGLIPSTELAVDAGLTVTAGGIAVNELCQTSDPSIYAVGDVTWHHNRFYDRWIRLESVQNAVDQAKVAAQAIAGDTATYYDAQPWFWSDQYDLKLQMVGLNQGYDQAIIRGSLDEGRFACFYLKDSQMIAADCVRAMGEFMGAKKLIAARVRVSAELLQDMRPFKEIVAELLAD